MKNLFEPSTVEELKERTSRLAPDSPPQWGKMTLAQMLAHCSAWMEMAAGLTSPPRSLIGRIVGPMAKSQILSAAPIRRNMPTDKCLMVTNDRNFAAEQQRLLEWIDSFATGGPEACTKHPHCFFGPLTPNEWATMGYKHLDHHLRQFGA